jgi:hypothetical protein
MNPSLEQLFEAQSSNLSANQLEQHFVRVDEEVIPLMRLLWVDEVVPVHFWGGLDGEKVALINLFRRPEDQLLDLDSMILRMMMKSWFLLPEGLEGHMRIPSLCLLQVQL